MYVGYVRGNKHPMRVGPSPGRGGGHLLRAQAKHATLSKITALQKVKDAVLKEESYKKDTETDNNEQNQLQREQEIFFNDTSKDVETRIPFHNSEITTTKRDYDEYGKNVRDQGKFLTPKYKYRISKKTKKMWREMPIERRESQSSQNYYSILEVSNLKYREANKLKESPEGKKKQNSMLDSKQKSHQRNTQSDVVMNGGNDGDELMQKWEEEDEKGNGLQDVWEKVQDLVDILKIKNFTKTKKDGVEALSKEYERLSKIWELRIALRKGDEKLNKMKKQRQLNGSFAPDFHPDPDDFPMELEDADDVEIVDVGGEEINKLMDDNEKMNEIPNDVLTDDSDSDMQMLSPSPTFAPRKSAPNLNPVTVTPVEKKLNEDNSPTMIPSVERRKEKLLELIIRHNEDLGRKISSARLELLKNEPIANLASIQSAVSKEKYAFLKKQNLEKKFDEVGEESKRDKLSNNQTKITNFVEHVPTDEEKVHSYIGGDVTDQGLNVSKYTKKLEHESYGEDKSKPPPVPKATLEPAKRLTYMQQKHSYTARFRIHVDGIANVGFILKQMFQLWREVDRATIFHEFLDEKNLDTVIDHENRVPNNEPELRKYMAGLRETRNNMFFSVRISGEATLRQIKSAVTPWLLRHRSRVDFDMLKAERISTIGFFSGIHPDYYNRTIFKGALNELLLMNKVQTEINVYPRKLWTTHNEKQIATRALVIEVPLEERENVTEILINHQHEAYPNAEYVPFSSISDETYSEVMTSIFQAQNNYLHTRDKKVIYGINNAQTTYEMKDGSFSTFQEWVETINFNNETFIESCELGASNSLHVIFDKIHEKTVRNLFGTDFKALAAQFFHDSSLDQIFHPTDFRMAIGRNFSNAEMTYAEKLKRKYATLTQNGSVKEQNLAHGPPTKVSTKNLSYSKFSKSSDLQMNPYVDAVKQTKQKFLNVDDRLDKLEASMNEPNQDNNEKPAIKAMSQEEWSQKLEKKFNERMKALDEKFNEKLQASEQNTRKLIEESEERMIASFEKSQKQQAEHIDTSIQTQFDAFFAKMNIMNMMIHTKPSESTTPITCQIETGIGGGKNQ